MGKSAPYEGRLPIIVEMLLLFQLRCGVWKAIEQSVMRPAFAKHAANIGNIFDTSKFYTENSEIFP
jgi:hypothetical protein